MDFRFLKKHRIRAKKDMVAFLKSRTISCSFLKIAYKQNNLGYCRLLIKIRRTTCNAVHRNSIKRKTREFFRQNTQIIKSGYDLCFIFKKDYFDKDEIITLLKKSNLLV